MSLVLRSSLEPINTARITLSAAVAVAEAIRETTKLPASIKWPNDILINGRKVCGILTEMKAQQDEVEFVILGIGINVNNCGKDLPMGSTSLKEELGGGDSSRVEVTKRLLELFESRYFKISDRFNDIIEEWRRLSDTLGRRVRVHSHGQMLEGQALDVDDSGGLILRLDSGFSKHILSGDVELAR